MAKLTDELMQETLKAQLQEGETLKHWAFGVKQPSMIVIVPLIALAILPGVIATFMLTKNYLVGVTDKRFIVLQIKSISNTEIKAIIEYPLDGLKNNGGGFKPGKLFTYLSVDQADKPFNAKFHRMFSKDNRSHAEAIGHAISGA